MIKPYIFDNQTITAAAMRSALQGLGDGILSGCNITYTGTTFTIGAGALIAAGGAFRLSAAEAVAVAGAVSGVARIKVVIDTNEESTSTSFEQISFDVDYAGSAASLPELSRDDINTGNGTYELELAVVTLGAAGITGMVRKIGAARAFIPESMRGTELPAAVAPAGYVFYKIVG